MFAKRYVEEWSGPQLHHRQRVGITKRRDNIFQHVAFCEHVSMMMIMIPFGQVGLWAPSSGARDVFTSIAYVFT
jgi:hypothetical protein